MGDFNVVRRLEERIGRLNGSQHGGRDIEEINAFIDSMELLDVLLVGRSFTWVRAVGVIMNRLDRVKSISNHCPITLKHKFIDRGPRPFKVFNHWIDDPRFVEFVKKKYESYNEKLKILKLEIKNWSKEKFEGSKENMIVDNINNLGLKEEIEGLSLELAFGLKVNFFKSSFGGIHVDQNWINTNAKMVNCTTMTILFVYLGLLVGANARKHPRNFSIVFKGIFFRGAIGEEIKRVRWYVVYSPIEIGSLGIKDLETFNKLLVGQMAIEVVERKKCLWRDVLKEKYKISSWDSLVRCNFVKRGWGGSQNVLRVIGEGREVSFCNSKWVGKESLGKKFN
ncbi:hypothetical protein HKD37_02G004816 [Glycine soja]